MSDADQKLFASIQNCLSVALKERFQVYDAQLQESQKALNGYSDELKRKQVIIVDLQRSNNDLTKDTNSLQSQVRDLQQQLSLKLQPQQQPVVSSSKAPEVAQSAIKDLNELKSALETCVKEKKSISDKLIGIESKLKQISELVCGSSSQPSTSVGGSSYQRQYQQQQQQQPQMIPKPHPTHLTPYHTYHGTQYQKPQQPQIIYRQF